MEITGYIASLLMGILLGLIGGGGSILTVPILVYLFGISPSLSTAYSLFIVGVTSLAGSFSHFKKGNVNLKMALIFGVPSLISVFLVRLIVLPAIPVQIFSTGTITLSKDTFILVLFAVLMVLAAWSMIRPDSKAEASEPVVLRPGLIIAEGVLVGGLTGLVGAGGGFLIIPALVILTGMKMKEAVGTSLLIITMKSLIGFLGDVPKTSGIDYSFLIFFTVFAVAGILIGSNLSKVIDNRKLKPGFGWFVLVTGVLILIKEIFFNQGH
ncbi:MAG: sulfite exporter TauE/SafE family protein [Cyclobacteriaceae bacterium]